MADGKEDGQSASRYFTRKRPKRVKTVEVVELSDSSSECNDEDDVPTESNTASSNKSMPLPEQPPMECPVCLQACMHPARLPCGHIFCFLCLKGIAQQSKRCAMCRQEISPDYLDRPDLLDVGDQIPLKEVENEYQWFYEGRNGWWQYDERTSRELEASYNSGIRTCELLIAGFLYTADFDSMVQMRRNEPHRRRRIKRDLATIPKKGVAGIRHAVNVDSVLEQFSSLTLSDNPGDE